MPLINPESVCGNCRWFERHPGSQSGECHGEPPRAGPQMVAAFPVVLESQWCRTFAPMPKPKREAPEPPVTDLRP